MLEAGLVEVLHSLLIQRAAVRHEARQIRLRRIIHGIDARQPGGDGRFMQRFFETTDPGEGTRRGGGGGGCAIVVVADQRDIAVVRDADHGDPEHEGTHQSRGEDAAGRSASSVPGEELREPAHAVEEDGKHKDGGHPGAHLHHPRLRRARDEREEGEAIFLDKYPGSDSRDHSHGEQEHLDHPFEKGKANDRQKHNAHDDGHGWDGIEGGHNQVQGCCCKIV